VVSVVGGPQKADLARSLGAEVVLDHHDGRWLDQLAAVQPSVIFDGVGGADASALPATVRPGGSYLNYGNAGGDFAGDLSGIAARAGIRAIGGEILGRLAVGRRERQLRILQRAADGEIRAHIGGRYPLAEAAEAHRALAGRAVAGKLLLDCRTS
jgi:NADPH2:quinone reductase